MEAKSGRRWPSDTCMPLETGARSESRSSAPNIKKEKLHVPPSRMTKTATPTVKRTSISFLTSRHQPQSRAENDTPVTDQRLKIVQIPPDALRQGPRTLTTHGRSHVYTVASQHVGAPISVGLLSRPCRAHQPHSQCIVKLGQTSKGVESRIAMSHVQ